MSTAEILNSIGVLKSNVVGELVAVLRSPATPAQQDEVWFVVKDLWAQLDRSAAAVQGSTDATGAWNMWAEQAIVPLLTSLGKMVAQHAGFPKGLCVYEEGQFCSTEAECNLPGSMWTPGSPC